jgi:hypothetical protein
VVCLASKVDAALGILAAEQALGWIGQVRSPFSWEYTRPLQKYSWACRDVDSVIKD